MPEDGVVGSGVVDAEVSLSGVVVPVVSDIAVPWSPIVSIATFGSNVGLRSERWMRSAFPGSLVSQHTLLQSSCLLGYA
jgi:hypothetical protein